MPATRRVLPVRSHRRGGPRRRIRLAPWIISGVVLVLVGAGVTAGYAYLTDQGCSGRTEATILVSPRVEAIVRDLGQRWAQTSPSVGGACGFVTVSAKEPSDVVAALGAEWDTTAMGPAPDVWVPDSTAWVRMASADADRVIPDLLPSLARTPTVIAMPRPLADAAGMTAAPPTWQQVIAKLSAAAGWRAYQHAEWGRFKVGLSDPRISTAGLLALMAISDTNDSGDISGAEQAALVSLNRAVTLRTRSTTEIFDGLRTADQQGQAAALTFVSAFPALEHEVVAYNVAQPRVPLVAIYPHDGTAEADFPYLILDARWSEPGRRAVAAQFLTYLRGPAGRAAFLDAGFRDSNRVAGPSLTAANGVTTKITALPRADLAPESVQRAVAAWSATAVTARARRSPP